MKAAIFIILVSMTWLIFALNELGTARLNDRPSTSPDTSKNTVVQHRAK